MQAAFILSALLLFVPAAAAQGHAHGAGSGIHITSDLGPAGLTTVGALNRFFLIAYGDDDVPDFHQDLPMRVLLDERVVFELDADAGHDYDGVRDLWIAFGQPGTYRVEALDGEGRVVAHLEGQVRPIPLDAMRGGISAGTSESGSVLGNWRGELSSDTHHDWLLDLVTQETADSDPLAPRPHPSLEFSTTLTGAAAGFHLARQSPGTHYLEGVIYDHAGDNRTSPPAGFGGSSMPTMGSLLIPPGGQPASLPLGPLAANAVARSGEGPLRLTATYDPWTRVGPSTLQTLAILATDSDGLVNASIESRIVDARGRLLWESAHGHAPAGIWTLSSVQALPGLYQLEVTARSAAGEARLAVPWTVLPPVEPDSVGRITLTLDGLEGMHTGSLADLVFHAVDERGAPVAHADLVVSVWGRSIHDFPPEVEMDDTLLLRTKVHTHGDGSYRLRWSPPDWVAGSTLSVHASPVPQEPRAVLASGATWSAQMPVIETQALPPQAPAVAEDAKTPLPLVVVVAALALAVGLRRRR